MTIPAPWSLPADIRRQIMESLTIQAALNTASQRHTVMEVGAGEQLVVAIDRQWRVQERLYPEARIG